MKTNFKLPLTLVLGLSFLFFQSVKDYCENKFQDSIEAANREYQVDLTNCKGAKLSHLCFTEANLSYEKQVSDAYLAFNSCYNRGKD